MIESIFFRTPAREIKSCAAIIELVSNVGIVKETKINNTFKVISSKHSKRNV